MPELSDYLRLKIETQLMESLYSLDGSSSSSDDGSGSEVSFENILNNELLSIEDAAQSDTGDLTGGTETDQSNSFENMLLSGLTGGYSLSGLGGLNGSASVSTAGEASGMKASDNLVSFIANHEGYSATPYRGIDYQNETIGYGHVIKSGENLDNLSQSDALQLLKSDIKPCVDSVNREFAGVKLTQPQFDSLVSFSYALGTNVWKNVPTLTSDIKAGASAETLKQDFAACDHCNGVEVKGLLNRRMDEWKMFVSGEYE